MKSNKVGRTLKNVNGNDMDGAAAWQFDKHYGELDLISTELYY